MAYEKTFNLDLARNLIGVENPEQFLDEELKKIKERALTLNKARAKMAQGYQLVLEGLHSAYNDLDLSDPNLDGTPDRMARALLETCEGLGVTDKEIFSRYFPSDEYDEMVMLKDIEYTSLCAHHFFPFIGRAHIGYLPGQGLQGGKVVGLSKLARIVDAYACRPQLQERLCIQLVNAIKDELRPAGVMVVLEGKHGCLSCRGAKKTEATMITSSLYGVFKNSDKLRNEFLSLLKKENHI